MGTSLEVGSLANRRRRPLALLLGALLAVTVVAASCSSSDDDSVGELLPFEQVQDSPFVFEADPNNPGRGIFRMTTTEPMICTIVWGETDEFGNFNNSLAMNGTGLIQHDVVLPGAEAGVEYKFRVQGSTANGDQFRSEMGTFVIPAVETDDAAGDDEMAAHGDNLALSATLVEVSSVFGAGWEAENALDDDLNSEWATSGDGDSGFIVIDLGSPQEVVGVEFLTRSMLDGTATTEQFTLTVDDGETFGPFPAGNPANAGFAEAVFTGQILRFDVETSTGGNVGAVEVRAFAPAAMDG